MGSINIDVTLTKVETEVNTEEVVMEVVLNQVQPIDIYIDQAVIATSEHNQLANLGYEESGHTGFAAGNEVVKLTGDQTIEGVKTFNDTLQLRSHLVNLDGDELKVANPIIQLNSMIASDTELMKKTGIETKRGVYPKTGIYYDPDDDQWNVDNKKIVVKGDTLDGGTW